METISGGGTHFIFGGDGGLLAEHTTTGTLVRNYVYLNGQPFAVVDGSGNVSYILSDQTAQPQKMLNASATVTWQRVAGIFGDTVSQPVGSTSANPQRFAGQQYDANTSLHYNYFRDYDPATGRYIQSDPLGLAGGNNTYAYSNGNPVAKIDTSGLLGFGIIGAIGAEGGVGDAGAGANFSIGGGVFAGGGYGPSLGGFAAGGLYSQFGNESSHIPCDDLGDPNHYVVGASGGLGGGVFLTTANKVSDLQGPFDTTTIQINVGPLQGALQIGVDRNNTLIASFTTGPTDIPLASGASVSNYPTATKTWGR